MEADVLFRGSPRQSPNFCFAFHVGLARALPVFTILIDTHGVIDGGLIRQGNPQSAKIEVQCEEITVLAPAS